MTRKHILMSAYRACTNIANRAKMVADTHYHDEVRHAARGHQLEHREAQFKRQTNDALAAAYHLRGAQYVHMI